MNSGVDGSLSKPMSLPMMPGMPKGRFCAFSFPQALSTGPPSTIAASTALESPVIAEKLPPKVSVAELTRLIHDAEHQLVTFDGTWGSTFAREIFANVRIP